MRLPEVEIRFHYFSPFDEPLLGAPASRRRVAPGQQEPTRRRGRRRSQVHGPNACPLAEVEAFREPAIKTGRECPVNPQAGEPAPQAVDHNVLAS